jgi:HEAT repeat protein
MRTNPVFQSCTRLPAWLVAIFAVTSASAATPEVSQLISRFQAEPVFWKQQELASEIAAVATLGDLLVLEPWLDHRDRHIRGNVAYLFAQMGDKRGLATILEILADKSADRHVEWHGGSFSYTGNAEEAMAKFLRSPAALRAQMVTDRYYAVHLLGKLRDKRAVETLIPLLKDSDINYNVAWALGEIGDARAVPGLIDALTNSDAFVRVSAIGALEALRADQGR